MNVELSNEFSQAFDLLYSFCNICGVPTVVISKRHVRVSKLSFCYCIAFLAMYYVTIFYSCKKFISFMMVEDGVTNVTNLLPLFLGFCYISMCTLMNVFFFKRRVKFILGMAALDWDLKNFCRQRSVASLKNVVRFAICITCSKIILQTAIYLYTLCEFGFDKELWAPIISFILSVIWNEAQFSEICISLYILKAQIRYLNTTLSDVLKNKGNSALGSETISKILYQFKTTHKKASKVTEDLNSLFGVIILGQILIIFIKITTGLYQIFQLSRTLVQYFDIINSAVECIWLCFLADNFTEQAKVAGRAIYKINIHKISTLSDIELVSLQVISYRNRITAAELFNIDNRLLFAMVQAIFAYYIILVQMSPK